MEEDKKWLNVKAGTSSLTSFYICTAITFLDKWPVEPDAELLAKAGGDITKAKELVQNQYVGVSLVIRQPYEPSHLFLSVFPTGLAIGTTPQNQIRLPLNLFLTSPGRTRARGRRCSRGRLFRFSTIAQRTPRSVSR